MQKLYHPEQLAFALWQVGTHLLRSVQAALPDGSPAMHCRVADVACWLGFKPFSLIPVCTASATVHVPACTPTVV